MKVTPDAFAVVASVRVTLTLKHDESTPKGGTMSPKSAHRTAFD
jgi:hypothetical protein